jgi:molecular chaperone DnaK (HSP70)
MHAAAVGVDLGSTRALISVAKKGGVEVITNDANYRETKNVVGFGDGER